MNCQKIGNKLHSLDYRIILIESGEVVEEGFLELWLDPSMLPAEKIAAFIRFYMLESTEEEYLMLFGLKEVKNGLAI